MPASSFSVLDFPAPLGPISATASPGAMEKDTPSRALRCSDLVRLLKRFDIASKRLDVRSWNIL